MKKEDNVLQKNEINNENYDNEKFDEEAIELGISNK